MHIKEAIEVVDQHGIAMVDDPDSGIELVAVGRKGGGSIADGGDDYCVAAFVKERLDGPRLSDNRVRHFASTYAEAVGGKPGSEADIDVVASGSSFAPHIGLSVPTPQRGRYGGPTAVCDSQKWFSSLRCGIGITNPTNAYPNGLSVGTAGFFMRNQGGELFVVSNNHVIGRSNDASNGEVVVQPGTLDLTDRELLSMPTLADLEAALGIAEISGVVQLQFRHPAATPNNRVDAAIARLRDAAATGRVHTDLDRLTYAGGVTAVGTVPDPRAGPVGPVRVHKVGRTTGFTEGVITHIRGTGNIPYPGGAAFFNNQLVIHATSDNLGPFSRKGDSGSGIFNERNELVGLLFAGSDDHTLANPIDSVITEIRSAAGDTSLEVVLAT